MSTWHYLECTNHHPFIRGSEEVEQHSGTATLAAVKATVRNREEHCKWMDETDDLWGDLEGYADSRYVRNALWFIKAHPTCGIDLVTEYGDRERLVDSTDAVTAALHSAAEALAKHDVDSEIARSEQFRKKANDLHDLKGWLRVCDDNPEGHAEFYREACLLIFGEYRDERRDASE